MNLGRGISSFSNDAGAERKYYINLLRSMAYVLIALSAVFILISILFFPFLLKRALFIAAIVLAASGVALWMMYRGYIRQAGVLFVGVIWLGCAYIAYMGGGLNAPIISANFVLIIVASALLGHKGGVSVAAASILYGFFLAANDTLAPVEYSPYARLFIYAFFLVLTLYLQQAAFRVTEGIVSSAYKNETQYRLFLENIPIVTYINDLSIESHTIYISPQVTDLLGYSVDECLQDPLFWRKLVHPEDYHHVFEENRDTSKIGRNFLMDYRLKKKNGDIIWVRDEAILVRDENDAPLYWLGVWTDITNRKSSEHELERVIRMLTTRTNQLMTASEISNAISSILNQSELLRKVVELIRSQFDYYYVGIFLLEDEKERAFLRAGSGEAGRKMLAENHFLIVGGTSMIGWCIANNKARIAQDVGKEVVRFDNPHLPLSKSELALPMRAHGDVIGAMSIQSTVESAFSDEDIKALQIMADQVANAIETARLFNERAELIDELGARNAELERFTYTVSHDLKSPLVTIKGYIGYLKKDLANKNFSRFEDDLERIRKASETMQALLNDLLDLSRVGRVVNLPQDVPFKDIVDEAYEVVIPPAIKNKLQFIVQPDLPIVHCDKVRLVEVMQNLISNSIKFMGDQEEPVIEVGTQGVEKNFAVIYVRDNGIGIEKQFQEQVFGLFNRLNPQMEGTGIGLALVKRIIEFHYGRIWLESEGIGMGTTVFFTLPLAEGELKK